MSLDKAIKMPDWVGNIEDIEVKRRVATALFERESAILDGVLESSLEFVDTALERALLAGDIEALDGLILNYENALPPPSLLQSWVSAEPDDEIRSLATEAYSTRRLAVEYGAEHHFLAQRLLEEGDNFMLEGSKIAIHSKGSRLEQVELALHRFMEARDIARKNNK